MSVLEAQKITLEPVLVHHCFYSTGLVIRDLEFNHKIVFSCDRDGRLTNRLQLAFFEAM